MSKEVIAVDFYNLALTGGGVCMTVRAKTGDNEHTPCVLIPKEPIAFTTEMTPKVDGGVLRSPYEAEIIRTHNV